MLLWLCGADAWRYDDGPPDRFSLVLGGGSTAPFDLLGSSGGSDSSECALVANLSWGILDIRLVAPADDGRGRYDGGLAQCLDRHDDYGDDFDGDPDVPDDPMWIFSVIAFMGSIVCGYVFMCIAWLIGSDGNDHRPSGFVQSGGSHLFGSNGSWHDGGHTLSDDGYVLLSERGRAMRLAPAYGPESRTTRTKYGWRRRYVGGCMGWRPSARRRDSRGRAAGWRGRIRGRPPRRPRAAARARRAAAWCGTEAASYYLRTGTVPRPLVPRFPLRRRGELGGSSACGAPRGCVSSWVKCAVIAALLASRIGEASKPGPPATCTPADLDQRNGGGGFDDPEDHFMWEGCGEADGGYHGFFDDGLGDDLHAGPEDVVDPPTWDDCIADTGCEPEVPPSFLHSVPRRDGAGEGDCIEVDFYPAATFGGPWPGMYFTCGERGCGYYPDRRARPRPQPVPICLDQLLGPHNGYGCDTGQCMDVSPSTTGEKGDAATTEAAAAGLDRRADAQGDKVPTRRGRGRASKGEYVIKEEVSIEDAGHRDAGLFAFDTVNGNAWGGTIAYLATTAADVTVMQETRRRRRDVPGAEAEAAQAGWNASVRPALVTEADGTSGGVGVATRKWIGLSRPDVDDAVREGGLSYRAQLRWVGCAVRGGLHCGSVWMFPTEGLSQRNRRLLDDVTLALKGVRGPWLLGGDWNLPPELLRSSGWLEQVGGTIIAPASPTCNDATYDYFIVANSIVHAVAGVSVVCDAGLEPHSPVRIYLRTGARRPHQRRLLAPKAFPITPPPGCPSLAANVPAWRATCIRGNVDPELRGDDREVAGGDVATCSGSSGSTSAIGLCNIRRGIDIGDGGLTMPGEKRPGYAQWVSAVEGDCIELNGMNLAHDGAPFTGRVGGPKFVWKPMAGCTAAPERFTSGTSRRWRCVAKDAAQLLGRATALADGHDPCSTVLNTAARAVRRLAAAARSASTTLVADPSCAAAAAALHHADDPEALRSIVATARDAATKEERTVAHNRRQQWRDWLVGGKSQGLGRQHRFTKPRGGWTPSGVAHAPPTDQVTI